MGEKSIEMLRNGLEDSYWYGDDDEKVFNELVRKAEAYDGKSVKPIEAGMDSVYVRFHECPECGGADIIYEFNFCPDCGVKLDWSDSQ